MSGCCLHRQDQINGKKRQSISETKMGIGQFMFVCTSATTAIDAYRHNDK